MARSDLVAYIKRHLEKGHRHSAMRSIFGSMPRDGKKWSRTGVFRNTEWKKLGVAGHPKQPIDKGEEGTNTTKLA